MKTKIKHIFQIITSKTFLGALAFSIALWLYITLNTEFVSFVKVPLAVKLPGDKSIEKPIPKYVSVEIRATGWQIFNLKYLNTSAECNIDLSRGKIKDKNFVINRSDIIKNLENMGNVQTMDIVPQSVGLTLGKIGEYTVLVKPNVEIKPRQGYLLVGDIKTNPALVTIRGNDKKIRGINSWKTEYRIFKDVYEPINVKIPLSDTLTNIIKLSVKEVMMNADVQKIAEITIKDVPLQFEGADLPSRQSVAPLLFDITLRGGIHEITNLNYDDITISINTTDIVNDATGLLKPVVDVPQHFELIGLNPPYLTHTVKRTMDYLSRLK